MAIIEAPDPLIPGRFIQVGTTENPYFPDDEKREVSILERVCGYCETANDSGIDSCVACHGPLFDDISNRRNEPVGSKFGFPEWL